MATRRPSTPRKAAPRPSTSTRCRGGSVAIHGFKAYTAQSRHQRTSWIVIDEASERRRLAGRVMLGHKPDIHEPDVWRAIGENLSRQPEKQSALAMLHPVPEMARQEQKRRLRQGAAGA